MDGQEKRLGWRRGRSSQPASAIDRTLSSTATMSSTCPAGNGASGPCGLTSVNGDSYSNAALITPRCVKWLIIRPTKWIWSALSVVPARSPAESDVHFRSAPVERSSHPHRRACVIHYT